VPKCHLVHYPLRGGEQYNVVVTFHSREQEEWGVTDGSKEEVQSYFQGICASARQLIELPRSWKRWATADREPIGTWVFGRATLLGDAAHPTTQYMAQGACMALEDAVTLGRGPARALATTGTPPSQLYQRYRVARTARIVLSAPRDGAPVPRRGRGAPGAQRPAGRAARRSASTMRSNGSTAGTSTTACSRADAPPTAPEGEPRCTHSDAWKTCRRTTATHLTRHNLLPLWPNLRAVLPTASRAAQTQPAHCGPTRSSARCSCARGELTPMEKAERRVLGAGQPRPRAGEA
jgi:hypothetical protein